MRSDFFDREIITTSSLVVMITLSLRGSGQAGPGRGEPLSPACTRQTEEKNKNEYIFNKYAINMNNYVKTP